jgi:O-antigen/teichoic acid export membrane protein
VALVTPFNVATRLIECFRSIVVAAGGPLFGAMTELDGGRRHEDLRELLLRSTRFLALLSILGGVLLIVDGKALLRLWVGDGILSAYPVVALLAFGYIINLALHPMLLIVIAKGQHGPLGWWSIAEGIANIVLSVVWGLSHGLIGVAMGTIVPMLVVKLTVQPWYALKAAQMSAWDYIHKGLGRPLLVGSLFALVAGRISISASPTAPIFAATVMAQTLVFVTATWVFGLTSSERVWLWTRCRRRLGWPVLRTSHEVTTPVHAEFREQE